MSGINTLTYGSMVVPDHVCGVTSVPRRVTKPQVKACLWRGAVRIRDDNPAIYWEHTLRLYRELTVSAVATLVLPGGTTVTTVTSPASREAYAQDWYTLMGSLLSGPNTMTMRGDGGQFVFGTCVLDQPSLDEPRQLVLYSAGITELVFLGDMQPIWEED
jgi:hypothetical protein